MTPEDRVLAAVRATWASSDDAVTHATACPRTDHRDCRGGTVTDQPFKLGRDFHLGDKIAVQHDGGVYIVGTVEAVNVRPATAAHVNVPPRPPWWKPLQRRRWHRLAYAVAHWGSTVPEYSVTIGEPSEPLEPTAPWVVTSKTED